MLAIRSGVPIALLQHNKRESEDAPGFPGTSGTSGTSYAARSCVSVVGVRKDLMKTTAAAPRNGAAEGEDDNVFTVSWVFQACWRPRSNFLLTRST